MNTLVALLHRKTLQELLDLLQHRSRAHVCVCWIWARRAEDMLFADLIFEHGDELLRVTFIDEG
jgi:hypothetical protein